MKHNIQNKTTKETKQSRTNPCFDVTVIYFMSMFYFIVVDKVFNLVKILKTCCDNQNRRN